MQAGGMKMIEHVWLEHGIVRWHIGAVSALQYLESGAQLRRTSLRSA